MKKISEHIETLRGKPHHVRRRFATVTAATVSGAVGLVWLVGSLATGAFAVPNTSFADLTQPTNTVATTSASDASGLAGAAASQAAADKPAQITIVDTTPKTKVPAEQTTIPF